MATKDLSWDIRKEDRTVPPRHSSSLSPGVDGVRQGMLGSAAPLLPLPPRLPPPPQRGIWWVSQAGWDKAPAATLLAPSCYTCYHTCLQCCPILGQCCPRPDTRHSPTTATRCNSNRNYNNVSGLLCHIRALPGEWVLARVTIKHSEGHPEIPQHANAAAITAARYCGCHQGDLTASATLGMQQLPCRLLTADHHSHHCHPQVRSTHLYHLLLLHQSH
jgi:hypothetical protein